MKKIVLSISIVIMAIGAIFLSKEYSASDVSDLALANIEALADNESGGGQRIICYNKLEGSQGAPMEDKTWCSGCEVKPASKWSEKSECS